MEDEIVMHFYCQCGNRISDTTDHIPYKAHIIADQDWFDLFGKRNSEFDCIVKRNNNINDIIDKVIDLIYKTSSEVYQCEECGRLYIYDSSGRFEAFEPDSNNQNKGILQSIKGEKWQGFLYGEWKDNKPEWSNVHGYIFIECLLEGKSYTTREYDSFEVFQKEYFTLFEQLKAKNVLQSSQLKRNYQVLHSWEIEGNGEVNN